MSLKWSQFWNHFLSNFPIFCLKKIWRLLIILNVNYLDINVGPILIFLETGGYYQTHSNHEKDNFTWPNRFTNESYHNTFPKPQSFTFLLGNNDNFNGMGCHWYFSTSLHHCPVLQAHFIHSRVVYLSLWFCTNQLQFDMSWELMTMLIYPRKMASIYLSLFLDFHYWTRRHDSLIARTLQFVGK